MPGGNPTRTFHTLLSFLMVFLCAAGAAAQTQGSLRGLVTDAAGLPLPGVTVQLNCEGLPSRGALTDEQGAFEIIALPPASGCALTATLDRYLPLSLEAVDVPAGTTVEVRITLPPATPLRETIEVRARPQIVKLEETSSETRLSSEFIAAVPLLGRDYQDLLTLVPGVVDADGDGNPNIHGARDTDMVTLVDGVSTTDPLTGKYGAELNIESIQEIAITTSGATAEFSRAQGGFANILTKSGGNDFTGSVKFYWQGSALDGDGAGIDDPRLHGGVGESGLRDLTFNDLRPFVSLGGPIVRDRAWFYATTEYVQIEEPVNALNSAFVAGVQQYRHFLKLTAQATPNLRLALSYNQDPQKFLNVGLNSFTREESGFTVRQGGPIVTLKGVAILNPAVALETSVSSFDQRPGRSPTLDPDTNGNGLLVIDRNGNGFIEASERDPGEDYDGDGRFDVFESLDPGTGRLIDTDGDGARTPPYGCEGRLREDTDCDGHLDFANEDQNGDGILQPGEDVDGDGRLDPGTEDRDGDQTLDDTPRPESLYPYGSLAPEPADREYQIDQRRGIVSGPFYEDYNDRRRRFTFRQDLSVYQPDYWGSHDVKAGLVIEREDFSRDTESRAVVAPYLRTRREGPSTVRALLPAEARISNSATGFTSGLYLQDVYKPFPNLSVSLGLRYDHEKIDTFGYTFFDPTAERQAYDRLMALAGGERNLDDFTQGNNDGVISQGVLGDPLFAGGAGGSSTAGFLTGPLQTAALGRLTRHHSETSFTLPQLVGLYPELASGGEVNGELLAALGVTPQAREAFTLTNSNLAPRLSVSWDPWSNGRTKVFATWGRYFDKLFLNTVIGEEGPDTINRYYLFDPRGITGRGEPNHQIGRVLTKAPPSATQVDRQLQTPFSDELTFGFERELAPDVSFSLTYISRKFRQQLQDIDVNHSPRTLPSGQAADQLGGVPTTGLVAGLSPPDGRPDLYIRNFFFNQVLRVGNYNDARYRAIEVELLKRLSRRWELFGSYAYSRAVGAAEAFESELGNDPSTVESEYGYLEYDQRHIVKLSLITFLPRDWQLGATTSWSSGLPYSVVSRFFALDNVGYQQFRTRYGQVEPGPGNAYTFRDLGRNSERNHAVLDLNVSARKTLVIGRIATSLFVDVFNVLNSDDLRILTYEPVAPDRFNPGDPASSGPLQIDGTRRFGRRFQVGFQFDF